MPVETFSEPLKQGAQPAAVQPKMNFLYVLRILKKFPQYCDSFCGDRKCTVRSSNGIGQTEEQ
ncbi:hypothetical protein T09_12155 [Trichinella sp. T9]|nr:hypothetical protein T09_12155 [Trichinella sp. T9]